MLPFHKLKNNFKNILRNILRNIFSNNLKNNFSNYLSDSLKIFLSFILIINLSVCLKINQLILFNFNSLMVNCSQSKEYDKYVINTECPVASKIGQKMIEKGGNAVDAAIASAITIGIINSFSAGIGGGGFLLFYDKKTKDAKFFDFRETTPGSVTEEYFINNPKELQYTIRSACVPGEIKGLSRVHKKYGKLKWEELFEENIKICEEGFPASELLIRKLNNNKEDILNDEGFREIFTRNGEIIKVGDIVIRKNLGKTLRKISKDPEDFYNGEIANKIAAFSKRNDGFITLKDLNEYKCEERGVLKSTFKEFNVITTSLPSSGPFIVLALNILSKYDLNNFAKILKDTKNVYIYHFLIEIFKFMFYRRGEVEDPFFMNLKNNLNKTINSNNIDKNMYSNTNTDYNLNAADAKIQNFISQELANKYFKTINFDSPIDKSYFTDMLPFKDDHGTTHLNVFHEDICVCLTTTINLEFGSKVMDPETGIIFNNHMDDFSVPNVKSAYNIIGNGLFNRIEPYKRPFSSAAPTILEKVSENKTTKNLLDNNITSNNILENNDNNILLEETFLIGAAGGTKIPTSIISTILFYYLDRNLYNAISAPRLHEQLNSVVYVEPSFCPELQIKLKELGHNIMQCENIGSFTSVNAVAIKNGKIYAVADPRKKGDSCGT